MKSSAFLGVVVSVLLASLVIGTQPAPVVGPDLAIGPVREQRGLVLPTWERYGYSKTDTRGALRGIAAVGADWVQIVPTWYQVELDSNEIAPAEGSVDDGDVGQVISLARGQGLKVLLKPQVDHLAGSNRGRISPSDPDAWFRSYRKFISHYADLAQQLAVEQFAVGTELDGVSHDRQRWLGVVEEVRNRYKGTLVYAAHHAEYPRVAFWDAVDLVGIDAYWVLSAEPTAEVATLEAAFAAERDELAAFSARVGRPILFTEAGYPSQVGAATAPWDAHLTEQPAQDEQAAAYEALLATFSGQPWWAGVFWWTWGIQHRYSIDPSPALDHSVRGKLAESVLRKWWGRAPLQPANGSVDR